MQFLRIKYTRFLNTTVKGARGPWERKARLWGNSLRELPRPNKEESTFPPFFTTVSLHLFLPFSFTFFFLFFTFFPIPALYHIPRRETSTKLTTDTLTQQNTVMIIAKKLIKNTVGMYQFTFTPFRLLSSHRGIEAHIGPRTPHSRQKSPLCIGSSSSPGSPVFSSYFSQPCVSCSRARPFTLPLILLPLLATLIVSSVSLQSVPQLYP